MRATFGATRKRWRDGTSCETRLDGFGKRGSEEARGGFRVVPGVGEQAVGMREFGIRTIDGHRLMFGQEL